MLIRRRQKKEFFRLKCKMKNFFSHISASNFSLLYFWFVYILKINTWLLDHTKAWKSALHAFRDRWQFFSHSLYVCVTCETWDFWEISIFFENFYEKSVVKYFLKISLELCRKIWKCGSVLPLDFIILRILKIVEKSWFKF